MVDLGNGPELIGEFEGQEESIAFNLEPIDQLPKIKIEETDGTLDIPTFDVPDKPPEPTLEMIETEHELSSEEKSQLLEAIKEFEFTSSGKLGRTNVIEHNIVLKEGAKPRNQPIYRCSPSIQAEIDAEIERFKNMDVIEECVSEWTNPLVPVRKSNGKIRVCLDSRRLNSLTMKDTYPIRNMLEIFQRLEHAKFFSIIDLKDAYFQIPLREECRKYTAFRTKLGLFQFKVCPFGVTGAPAAMNRLMDRTIGFDLMPAVFVYLDDIVIATKTLTEHLRLPFAIESDASDTAVGAALTQEQEGETRIIAYFSKKLSRTQRAYASVEKECLGVLLAIENFRHYVEGSKFKVITDARSLLWLFTIGIESGKARHTCLLVATDVFSKFILVQPFREAKASSLTEFVKNMIFLLFGVPEVILTDNGTQFTSKLFKSLLEEYGVNHWLTPAYHPQVNNTERVNRVITTAIRATINQHKNWADDLQTIACAIRSAVHDSTKHSPYFVVFGRERISDGKEYQQMRNEQLSGTTQEEDESRKKLFEEIRKNLTKAYERHKKTYNLRSNSNCPVYSEGETVLKRTFDLSDKAKGFCSKLAPKFELAIATKTDSLLICSIIPAEFSPTSTRRNQRRSRSLMSR
ncbi:uncharacterized protein LOC129751973 [Uranotaenia lowii]|uniref:uncharacterized protein LOC129751973 n=1 Tax=Uranotaenia lowii TaxID=190385 RepID=UPI002479FEAA|nr:uncharacterized protein LOC129751973 [Uranotaenia lowii]